jgi:hypothetical protein
VSAQVIRFQSRRPPSPDRLEHAIQWCEDFTTRHYGRKPDHPAVKKLRRLAERAPSVASELERTITDLLTITPSQERSR